MRLSLVGEVVQQWWSDIPRHFPNAKLDLSASMPNRLLEMVLLSWGSVQLNASTEETNHSHPGDFTQPWYMIRHR